MISNIAQINTFTAGMDLDTDITVLPNNRYRYAENIRVLTNDQGTTSVALNLEGIYKYIMGDDNKWSNETIIGLTVINDIVAVITMENLEEAAAKAKEEVVNHIYSITGFDSERPTTVEVCKGKLNLSTRLSCTGVYENDLNVRLYFTDGKSLMKVINLLESKYKGKNSYFVDTQGYIKNPGALDYIPEAQLDPFTLNSVTSGSLPAGMVWYCYLLFNKFGTASKISPISNSFHLCASSSNLNTVNYMGSYEGENSSKGVIMSTPLHVHDFNYCRIYRIISTTNNLLPLIFLIDEIDISNTIDTITYVDRGSSFLSELTVDEFNNLANALFISSTITNKDNRLFAGNIVDDTWDCGNYDARAFRANKSGQVLINTATNLVKTFKLDNCDEELKKLDANHDCINPYNLVKEYSTAQETNAYVYGKDNKLGGYGLNIEYTFITTDLHLTNKLGTSATNGKAIADTYNDVQAEYGADFKLYEWANNNTNKWVEITPKVSLGSLNDKSLGSRLHNYADPEVDSILEGYQRDEIYRFGIVFYNKKSIPSPVYWIGDIRMPHAGQVPMFEYKDDRLVAHPLGIRFKVKHIPEGAIAYEIVRCDRTEADRTIVTQCAATNVYKYMIQELGESAGHGVKDENSLELRPFVLPDFNNTAKTTYDIVFNVSNQKDFLEKLKAGLDANSKFKLDSDATPDNNYLRLISPEICISGDLSEDLFKGGVYLDYVSTYASMINVTSTNGDTSHKSTIAIGAYSGYALPFKVDNNTIHIGLGRTNNLSVVDDDIETEYDTDDYPLVHTLKYYNSFYDKEIVTLAENANAKPLTIIDAEYPLDIPYNAFLDVSAYKINVGMNTYTNYAHTLFKNADSRTVIGAAGPCVIVQLESSNGEYKSLKRYDLSNNNGKEHTGNGGVKIEKDYLATAIPYFNLKRENAAQYGGNNYSSRLNSVYISIGGYKRIEQSKEKEGKPYETYLFGGDTYLGMIDYPFTFVFQGNDIKTEDDNKIFINAYIPFESSINMNLMMGDTFSNNRSVYMLLTPIQMGSYHIQDKPYFVYNPVYSALQSAMIFTPELVYKSSLKHPNRLMVSQAKTNGEVIDNWTLFKVADYLDVDNKYGPITNIKEHNNLLLFWQRDAFGIAQTNEQSVITDNDSNQLILGSGTLLSRYDYISNTHGDSIFNDKSIIATASKLYWYDNLHNELVGYDGLLHSMGKECQTQSYLNGLDKKYRSDVVSAYDFKYNEVWFNFKDKKVLIFNELLNRFTSFYTYEYNWSFNLSDRSILVDDKNDYHVINNYKLSGLTKKVDLAKLLLIVNTDYPATKVYDNVRLLGNFTDKQGKHIRDLIFTAISFKTKHQTAVMKNDLDTKKAIMDYREDTYRFAIPRANEVDHEHELSLPARLRGKWLSCTYEFIYEDGTTFEIPQITTTFRKSLI